MRPPRIIFITGTDTGVGKTLLTGLLLTHLRASGIRTLALKPFCSGSRADVILLRSLTDHELTPDEINPFYFPEPIAPLVAARKHRRSITLSQVLRAISRITHHASLATHHVSRIGSHAPSSTLSRSHALTLLLEGAGGLLAPLAQDCTALDIIHRLDCEVLVVTPNKLGTINHTLLTIRALQQRANHSSRSTLHAPRSTKVVLMNSRSPDPSGPSNPRILSELLAPIPVHSIPFLGPAACRLGAIRRHAALLQRKLAAICRKAEAEKPLH